MLPKIDTQVLIIIILGVLLVITMGLLVFTLWQANILIDKEKKEKITKRGREYKYRLRRSLESNFGNYIRTVPSENIVRDPSSLYSSRCDTSWSHEDDPIDARIEKFSKHSPDMSSFYADKWTVV